MKALVLEQYNQLVYQDVPEPGIEPGEVLLKVSACGICGSDVHGLDGSTGRRVPPIIMGHEAAGEVVEVGAAVQGWKNGDRATFDCVVHCGSCYYCQRGMPNLCDNRRWIGVSLPHVRKHGAFAEYVAVPQQVLHRLPQGLSYPRAAMMEALSIAFHAVNRTPIALHDSAVVIGAGMIGLLIIQLLRRAGCSRIIAVDLGQDKLDIALRMGADLGLLSGAEDVPAAVAEHTAGRGTDIGFEVVGITPTMKMAVASVRKGGSLCLVGNFAPAVELPLQDVVIRQLSLYGTTNAAGEQEACLDLLASGAVKVDELISAVAPLSEGAAWFARLYKREPGLMKVILEP
jgi:L-iditol 2-dehydrogenase